MKNNFLNFKTMKKTKFYIGTFLSLAFLVSCSNDDAITLPPPIDDEEAITRVLITYTNLTDATDTVVLDWNDANLDEVVDAGEQTVTGEFNANAVYNATIELFNMEEDFLEEDITADQAGIDAHFFVYGTSLDFAMERASTDFTRSDNNKLGVITLWTAGATAATGDISIQLFHESPNVSDADGFGTAEGTDTDIDISFDVEIL